MATLLDAAAMESAAEDKVQAVLDNFLRNPADEQGFVAQLVAICRAQPDAAWQTLALLDRLHRRDVLGAALYQFIKEKLNEIVFCSTGTYVTLPPAETREQRELRIVVANRVGADRSVVNRDDARRNTLLAPANAISFLPLRPGATLSDRYLIDEPLATSSASTTFRAFDQRREAPSQGERQVAIRWLDENLQSNPHAIVALQNEYAHLQAIAHGNIPKVHDFNDVSGACFIALELPPGEFLSRLVERSTLKHSSNYSSLPLAMTVVREIGFALAKAHEFGVMHGSLSPSSVLITTKGDMRVYGIAQADPWAYAAAHATDANLNPVPIAARRYCSPQRRNFAVASVTDDVYSLACIAFELLTGRELDIDALDASDWRQPVYAKHLSDKQWFALCAGLSNDPAGRGRDVRDWLKALDPGQARWRLPDLATLEVEFTK